MIKYITTISVLFSCSILFAQKEIKESKIEISPRFTEQKEQKSNDPLTLPVSSKIDVSERNVNTSSSSSSVDKKFSEPVKATRMSENQVKSSITIDIIESRSHLDNLLVLIEEKENVNKFGPNLKSSLDYKNLISAISTYKNKFNSHVENTGIQNCSIKERNYYLAFLKEEGKEDEYKVAISKIK